MTWWSISPKRDQVPTLLFVDSNARLDHAPKAYWYQEKIHLLDLTSSNSPQDNLHPLEHHSEVGSLLGQFFQVFYKHHLCQEIDICKYNDANEQYYISTMTVAWNIIQRHKILFEGMLLIGSRRRQWDSIKFNAVHVIDLLHFNEEIWYVCKVNK